MRLLHLPISVILLGLTFYSCKKENNENPDNKRLVEIFNGGSDSTGHTFFFYDDKGRVATVIDSGNTDRYVATYNYHYNTDNELVTISRKEKGTNFLSKDSFIYDQQRRIQKHYLFMYNKYDLRESLTYDSKGRLIADTSYDPFSGKINSITNFIYDNMDNVITEKRLSLYYTPAKFEETRVTYTLIKNPLHPLAVIDYLVHYGESMQLSKFLVSKVQYHDGREVEFDYISRNGLLTTITKKITFSNQEKVSRFTNFRYE